MLRILHPLIMRKAYRFADELGCDLGLIPELLLYMKSRKISAAGQCRILDLIAYETGGAMMPLEEVNGRKKPYYPFHGRGLLKLKRKDCYELMGRRYGLDLLNNRHLVLTDHDLAVRIAVDGCEMRIFELNKGE